MMEADAQNNKETTALPGSEGAGGAAGTTTRPAPQFGWSAYAETLNGRFAMVGFAALLLLELFTRQDFFTWLGL